MFQITYGEMVAAVTLAWVTFRGYRACRNKKVDWHREWQLLTLYVCIVVIARIVYFPWHHVDGKIAPLVFDASKVFPLWLNPVPFVHMFDVYDGWKTNLFGNIAMFVPVGIFLPMCFKKPDNIRKTVLAGFCCSLFIEISQLPFFDRLTDADDLILNTLGALIGAGIYFGIAGFIKTKKSNA